MTVSNVSELFAALGASNVQEIVDTPEEEWIDFKRDPYNIQSDNQRVSQEQKLELAKDVAAFANGRTGGVIVIGFATVRDAATQADIASAVHRFPQSLVNFTQIRDTVESLTFPPIRNLEILWWMTEGNDSVLTIRVPPANEDDRPVVVKDAALTGQRRYVYLAIVTRISDRNSLSSAAEVHRLLHRGYGLRGELAGLQTVPLDPIDVDERTDAARQVIEAGAFLGRRRLLLQAWPRTDCRIIDIHESGPDGLAFRMAYPNEVRRNGFGLRSGAQAVVNEVGGLRILAGRHVLDLRRNGLLTWVAAADSDYLAHADENRGQRHWINQLALVESILEFFRFYLMEVLTRCEPIPSNWAATGSLCGLRSNSGISTLSPGPLSPVFPEYEIRPAPTDEIDLGIHEFSQETPGEAAFAVTSEIYSRFGIERSAIPYSVEGATVDELIRSARA